MRLKSAEATTYATTATSTTLKVGSKGTAVTELQKNLTKLGYDTKGTDGIFGTGTKNAVIAFQRDHGLGQDGIVGNDTKKAINKALDNINTGTTTPFVCRKYEIPKDTNGEAKSRAQNATKIYEVLMK